MSHFISKSRNFSNRRDWNDYLSRLQNAVASPKIGDALRAGRAWLNVATEYAPWTRKVTPLGQELASDVASAAGIEPTASFKTAF